MPSSKTIGGTDVRCCGHKRASVKKLVRPDQKREAVTHLQAQLGLSQRRTCSIVGTDRKMIPYQSARSPAENPCVERVCQIGRQGGFAAWALQCRVHDAALPILPPWLRSHQAAALLNRPSCPQRRRRKSVPEGLKSKVCP